MGDFTEVFFRHQFEGLIFAGGGGGAYTWRGLFSEFNGISLYTCIPIRQDIDKTFIIIILQVQFFGPQLARKR